MARIFISYSNKDKKIALQYAALLREYKHTIVMDDTLLKAGEEMQNTLMKGQREADGTIVLLTPNSFNSPNVISELGMARTYWDKEKKFLIPIVKGKIELPYVIRDLFQIQIDNRTAAEAVKQIHEAISQNSRLHSNEENPKLNSGDHNQNEPTAKPDARIKEIQTILKNEGFFKSAVDGIRGPATIAAIQEFQQKYSLPQHGEWLEAEQQKYEEVLKSTESFNTSSNVNRKENKSGNTKVNNYWLLKIYGDDWGTENIDENDEGHFNSHFNSKLKRPDYENFTALRIGDRGVAYDYSSLKAILFIFEVIQPLHIDPVRDEIFKFKVLNTLSPYLPFSSFKQLIGFNPNANPKKQESLFRLSETEYNAIISLIDKKDTPGQILPAVNIPTLSEVFSDSASKDIKDQLGFESDINALASVIAYQEVKPPLAVGLFGHWGSGKSFFMNKLQKRIEELAKDESGFFCKKVVQINFNSWHYSDSNLWASLITKIFDDLKKHGEDDKPKLENLFNNLNSTQELLNETKQKITNVETEIKSLESRHKLIETEIQNKTRDLKNLSPDDITKAVMADPVVAMDLENLKKQFDFLNLKEYKEIQTNIDELETGGKRLVKSLQLLYSLRNGRSWFAVLIAAFIFIVVYYAIEHVEDLKIHLGKYKEIISGLALLVSQGLLFLKPWLKKIKDVYTRLSSLKDTCNNIVEQKRNEFNAERDDIKIKLEGAQAIQNDLRQQIEQLESKKSQLEIEITDITSGRRIIRFIEGRVTDERYVNSLGIISWIRKDFEELDFLLKQQYDTEKIKELNRKAVANVFKIDRIILYIDDLDRCDVNIVVRVLEAINLLLAFPLFVVIVGVDPRWMHNALSVKYSGLLKSDKDNGNDPDTISDFGHPATSYDYLEKIFQIPFVLKPMDKTGKENLIKSQLEKKLDPPTATEDIELLKTIAEKENPAFPSSGSISPEIGAGPAPLPDVKDITTIKQKTDIIDPAIEIKPEEKKIKMESLHISEEEIKFMQAISFLIGDSPRTIKRYINMYRIIRTHAMFEFTDDKVLEHYFAAMILLGVITGLPEDASAIFEKIKSFEDSETFSEFLDHNGDVVNKRPHPYDTMKNAIKNDTIVKPLGDIQIKKFKKNISLISRFSFRHLEQ